MKRTVYNMPWKVARWVFKDKQEMSEALKEVFSDGELEFYVVVTDEKIDSKSENYFMAIIGNNGKYSLALAQHIIGIQKIHLECKDYMLKGIEKLVILLRGGI